jgi:signal transduction histidine kinase
LERDRTIPGCPFETGKSRDQTRIAHLGDADRRLFAILDVAVQLGTTLSEMNIVLVSEDPEVRELCRDLLREQDAGDLTMATPDQCPVDADLYIWDEHATVPPTVDTGRRSSRHLLLLHPDEMERDARASDGTFAVEILLKPLTRRGFAAFLRLAAKARQDERNGGSHHPARNEYPQPPSDRHTPIQKYDEERTNFLARALHDFRAPLMSADGYSSLLLCEALGPQNEQQKEVLRRMQHSIKRLSRLASAMFELSVGNRLRRKPDLRAADIPECVEQALHEIAPLANGKRINISVDMAESENGRLYIEPSQIEQVLINILENACKFTPKAGEIAIRGYPYFWDRRCEYTGGLASVERRVRRSYIANAYRIDIRDSGPAIPEELLTTIFEEYTTYSGGLDRSGGGLGLAICKMILHAHAGRIWAENSAIGPNICFVLPVRSTETS